MCLVEEFTCENKVVVVLLLVRTFQSLAPRRQFAFRHDEAVAQADAPTYE